MLTYQISPWIFFLLGAGMLRQVIESVNLVADRKLDLE
jgi:hypothetical protein